MGYTAFAICWCAITTILLLLAVYIYLKLIHSVKNNEVIPGWIYKIGHAIRGRGMDCYENITDANAIKEINRFLSALVMINILVFGTMLLKGRNVNQACFFCLKVEFYIYIAVRLLCGLFALCGSIAGRIRKSCRDTHSYASANAVRGMLLVAIFFLEWSVMMTGVPAKPMEIQIADSQIIPGKTTASELLQDGFTFYMKDPDDEIVNHRDSHFYYGEMAELVRDGKAYGIVCLTPKLGDSSRLKNCVITYYAITAQTAQFDEIKICSQDISKLTREDFFSEKIADIFSLAPADYEETKGDYHFSLRLQLRPYMLWTRYSLEARFNEDGTPAQYEVFAQHTIWE